MNYIAHVFLGINDGAIFKDYRLWLLLVCLNTGANLGFNYLFPQQTVLSILFIVSSFITLRSYHLSVRQTSYIAFFAIVLLIQAAYLRSYSVTTSLHYFMLVSSAVMIVNMCRNNFASFFSGIICVYALISLGCFVYTLLGGHISHFPIADTNIDDGQVLRVFNLYYTQLGNPDYGLVYNIRNCGPFWEPGAYQGFLNLALWFELKSSKTRDRWWIVRVLVLVVSILTTVSTGGYIVLFFILLYYFINEGSIKPFFKYAIILAFLLISCYLFFSLDFMAEKITSDEARTDFSFTDFPNILYVLFGYGYSVDSFSQSSVSSASSVFSLFRYLGLCGAAFFMLTLLLNRTPHKLPYFGLVTLILMNEPFLSVSLIWWGVAFVTYERYNENRKQEPENIYYNYSPRTFDI